jgi:hypothetical protein
LRLCLKNRAVPVEKYHFSGKRVNQTGAVNGCYRVNHTRPMSAATKAVLASLLNGVAWLLFVVATFAFLCGGGLIHAITKTERSLAEVEGIGLAALSGGVGAIAKAIATRLEVGDGLISLSDSLRK